MRSQESLTKRHEPAGWLLRPRRDAGFGLIELVGAGIVLFVAVGGVLAMFVSTARSHDNVRENLIGRVATRNIIDDLSSRSADALAAEVLTSGGAADFWCLNDGQVVYSAPANSTWVVADGTVTYHDDELDLPAEFDLVSGSLDLDANGALTGTVAGFRVLPITIELRFTGPTYQRTITTRAIIRPRSGG